MIYFGVDIGGTGCKCVAFSDEGRQLTVSYDEYPVPVGSATLNPRVLTNSVFKVIKDCADAFENKNDIAAITVSSFGESFVAVGKDGEDIDDIRMYFGASEREDFDRLLNKVGENKFMKICRTMPDAGYSLATMLYTLKNADRPVWKFLFIAGYMCYRLSGVAATDISLACRSLLYDVNNNLWSDELLEQTVITLSMLPDVVQPGTPLGCILPELSQSLGVPESTLIVIGAHDQIVNALGAGVTRAGDAVDVSGTCECLTPLFAQMPKDISFHKYNFACVPYLDTGGYVTYAYNVSAGSVVRWFRDALAYHLKREGKSVYDVINEMSPSAPTSLMVLPFLQGIGGTPEVNPNATGLIYGLTTKTRLPDIYRAILEGITFEMRYNMEKLSESGIDISRMLVCGGGARSDVWLQIKADIFGCDILRVRAEETGAMGSAILGIHAVTGASPFETASRFYSYDRKLTPIAENKEFYSKRYELYKKVRSLYREI